MGVLKLLPFPFSSFFRGGFLLMFFGGVPIISSIRAILFIPPGILNLSPSASSSCFSVFFARFQGTFQVRLSI